mgnify:CR=1 FL=1
MINSNTIEYLPYDKYTKEQKDAAAIWDETVLRNYGYDMGQDKWFPE